MRRKTPPLHDVMVHCQSVSMRELMVAETYEAKRGATSYGVHIAKVEVNTLTGEVRPLEYAAVHDIGRAINPLMLKGQLAGAIQMGLGYGLCEDMAYDGEGKPLVQTLKKNTRCSGPPRCQSYIWISWKLHRENRTVLTGQRPWASALWFLRLPLW